MAIIKLTPLELSYLSAKEQDGYYKILRSFRDTQESYKKGVKYYKKLARANRREERRACGKPTS